MNLMNTKQATQSLRAVIPPERLAQKIERAVIGTIVCLVGLAAMAYILYSTFDALKAGRAVPTTLLLIGLGVSLGLMLFGANIVSTDLTKAALGTILGFGRDLIGLFGLFRQAEQGAPPANPGGTP